MPSVKQIEANRLNSRKSTGPRTSAGKAVVAANALKHGIFAQSPAIVGENSFAFLDLKDALLLRFQPATPEEASPCEQNPRLDHRSERLVPRPLRPTRSPDLGRRCECRGTRNAISPVPRVPT